MGGVYIPSLYGGYNCHMLYVAYWPFEICPHVPADSMFPPSGSFQLVEVERLAAEQTGLVAVLQTNRVVVDVARVFELDLQKRSERWSSIRLLDTLLGSFRCIERTLGG